MFAPAGVQRALPLVIRQVGVDARVNRPTVDDGAVGILAVNVGHADPAERALSRVCVGVPLGDLFALAGGALEAPQYY